MAANCETALFSPTLGEQRHQSTSRLTVLRRRCGVWDELNAALHCAAFRRMPESNDGVKFECWHHSENTAYVYIDPETHHAFMVDNGRLVTSDPKHIIDCLHHFREC